MLFHGFALRYSGGEGRMSGVYLSSANEGAGFPARVCQRANGKFIFILGLLGATFGE